MRGRGCHHPRRAGRGRCRRTAFELLADPVYVADLPAYTGVVSQAGVLAWTVGAAVALFAAALTGSRLLRDLGWLTAFLAIDDVFLLHDQVLPVPEVVFFAVLGVVVLLLLRRHLAALRVDRSRPVVAAGVALLASSVIADVSMLDKVTVLAAVAEEALKVAGIVAWSGALVVLAHDRVKPGLHVPPTQRLGEPLGRRVSGRRARPAA